MTGLASLTCRSARTLLAGVLAMAAAACTATPPVRSLPLAVAGAVGPFAQAEVLIDYDDAALQEGFRASVQGDGQRLALPWAAPSPDFFMVRWLDMAIADVDPMMGNEIVIFYASQRRGPRTPMERDVLVFGWDGKGFVPLPAVAARAVGTRSLQVAVRRMRGGRP